MKGIIEKEKVLVYDSKHVYLRYFTKVFPNYIFVPFLGNENDDFVLNEFDIVIFIMGSHMEFSKFFKVYSKGTPMIFGSSVKKICTTIEEMELVSMLDIKLIDMGGTKTELRDQIRFHLNQYSVNRLHN